MSRLLLVLFTVSNLLAQGRLTQGTNITCTTGVTTGRFAVYVACHFNENIRKTRRNFNVYHYPFSVGGEADMTTGNEIVFCNWIRGQDSLKCKTEPGFHLDEKVSDRLTVAITQVTADAAGVYVCQLVPDQQDLVLPCSLYVSEDMTQDGDKQTLTGQPRGETDSHVPVIIGLSGVIFIMVATIVAGITLFAYMRRKYNWTRRLTPELQTLNGERAVSPAESEAEDPTYARVNDTDVPLLSHPVDSRNGADGYCVPYPYSLPSRAGKDPSPPTPETSATGGAQGAASPGKWGTEEEEHELKELETAPVPSKEEEIAVQSSTPLAQDKCLKDQGPQATRPQANGSNPEHVESWGTTRLCAFLKEQDISKLVIDAFKSRNISGSDFEDFDYREALKEDVDETHLIRLGAVLQELKDTKIKQQIGNRQVIWV